MPFSGWQMADCKPAQTPWFTSSGGCSTVNQTESAGLHAAGSITSERQPSCTPGVDTSGVPSAFQVLEHPEARHGRGLSAFEHTSDIARSAAFGTGTKPVMTPLVACAFQRVFQPLERLAWSAGLEHAVINHSTETNQQICRMWSMLSWQIHYQLRDFYWWSIGFVHSLPGLQCQRRCPTVLRLL